MTPDFKLARKSVQRASIKVSSVMTIHKDEIPTKKVLGFDSQWEDEIIENLIFQKNVNID